MTIGRDAHDRLSVILTRVAWSRPMDRIKTLARDLGEG